MKFILFDLDGTLTDSKEGIVNCVSYALDHFNIKYSLDELEVFVGPPLKEQFMSFANLSQEEAEELLQLYGQKTAPYLADFEQRRQLNRRILEKILTEYRDCFASLVIPQDDSSAYGYTTVDREYLKQVVAVSGLGDVAMYPGADEVGMSLLASAACALTGRQPGIRLVFAHEDAPKVVPLYEDRPVGQTIPVLLATSGCYITEENPDIILYLNYPAKQPV